MNMPAFIYFYLFSFNFYYFISILFLFLPGIKMWYVIYRILYSTYTAGLNIAVCKFKRTPETSHSVTRPLPHCIYFMLHNLELALKTSQFSCHTTLVFAIKFSCLRDLAQTFHHYNPACNERVF